MASSRRTVVRRSAGYYANPASPIASTPQRPRGRGYAVPKMGQLSPMKKPAPVSRRRDTKSKAAVHADDDASNAVMFSPVFTAVADGSGSSSAASTAAGGYTVAARPSPSPTSSSSAAASSSSGRRGGATSGGAGGGAGAVSRASSGRRTRSSTGKTSGSAAAAAASSKQRKKKKQQQQHQQQQHQTSANSSRVTATPILTRAALAAQQQPQQQHQHLTPPSATRSSAGIAVGSSVASCSLTSPQLYANAATRTPSPLTSSTASSDSSTDSALDVYANTSESAMSDGTHLSASTAYGVTHTTTTVAVHQTTTTSSGYSSQMSLIATDESWESTSAEDEEMASTADLEEEEDDAGLEYEEFNPYLFIKLLPRYESVVPKLRPLVLPAKSRHAPPISLVLDLDETLVHCSIEPIPDADLTFPVEFNGQTYLVYVRKRPYLDHFLKEVSRAFEVTVFTASQRVYAETLLNLIDPKRRMVKHRLFRDSCLNVDGNYLKDLSVLGRDLRTTVLVDNSPHAFGFQVDNGVPIESWFDDPTDTELLKLLSWLKTLHGAKDVRPMVRKKFRLHELIAAARIPAGLR